MGFLDGLASGLVAAGQGEAAAQEGTLAGNAQRTQSLMTQLQLARQAKQDELTRQLDMAKIGNEGAAADLNRVKTAAGGFRPQLPPVLKLGPGENAYNPDGSIKVGGPAAKPGAPLATTSGFVDPDTGKPKLGANGKPLMPVTTEGNNTYVTGVGPDGKPTIFAGTTKGPAALTDTGVGKPATAGAGAQNAPQMGAAKANLEAAMKVLDDYDEKRKAGTANYTANEAAKGAIADSPAAITAPPGIMGALNSWGANQMGASLNKNNPDLAAYLTARKFVAEAILNTHKRPNQTQYEIEQSLSAPSANASNFQIDLAKSRRQKMYDEVFGGDTPVKASVAAPKTLSPEDAAHAQRDPAFKAWLVKQGIPVP